MSGATTTGQALPLQVGTAAEITLPTPAELLVAATEAAAQLEDSARFAHASMHDKAAATLRATAQRLRAATALATGAAS